MFVVAASTLLTDFLFGRLLNVVFGNGNIQSLTVMCSISAFSDLCTSVGGMLVLTSVNTSTFGLSARSTRCISYFRVDNLCVLLGWISWMLQASKFCVLRNC